MSIFSLQPDSFLCRRILLPLLPVWLPFAAAWVRARERQAMGAGVPLDAEQMADARNVGIREPERVRLLSVPEIPTFTHPLLSPLARLMRGAFRHTAGITLGHGILIRADCWGSRSLVVHELAHVAQYERLGGITGFLRVYLRECLAEGYPNGALEHEAIAAASRLPEL